MNFPAERSSAGVRFWRQDQRDQDGRPARMVWGGSGGAGLTRKGRAGLSSAGLGKRRRIQKWGCFCREPPRKKGSGSDEPVCALQLPLSVSDPHPEPGSRGRLSSAAALRTPTEKTAVRCPPVAWFLLLRDKD